MAVDSPGVHIIVKCAGLLYGHLLIDHMISLQLYSIFDAILNTTGGISLGQPVIDDTNEYCLCMARMLLYWYVMCITM